MHLADPDFHVQPMQEDHTLMSYWYPTPSALRAEGEGGTIHSTQYTVRLIAALYILHGPSLIGRAVAGSLILARLVRTRPPNSAADPAKQVGGVSPACGLSMVDCGWWKMRELLPDRPSIDA